MPTPKPPYPAAFCQQMVELVRAGRGISDRAREFGCNASSIHAWVKVAGGLDGNGAAGIDAPLSMNERQELIELRRKFKQVQQERDILAKATAWFAAKSEKTPTSSTNLVKANQAELPVRAVQDAAGVAQRLLRPAGATGLRANGLRGVSRRRGWCVATKRDQDHRPAPDRVQREFTATGINQLWVADMTYIPTWAGFVYPAVVLDVYSRKVVGWAFGQQQTAELVIQALNMALITRKPWGVIHHTDQGSRYTSLDFGKRCKEMGVRPSMGNVGDAYDNAMAESFFAGLECELIDRRNWRSFAEARMTNFTWIEGWYNPRRRHSGIGQKSPIHFEKELQDQAKATEPTPAELTSAGQLKI